MNPRRFSRFSWNNEKYRRSKSWTKGRSIRLSKLGEEDVSFLSRRDRTSWCLTKRMRRHGSAFLKVRRRKSKGIRAELERKLTLWTRSKTAFVVVTTRWGPFLISHPPLPPGFWLQISKLNFNRRRQTHRPSVTVGRGFVTSYPFASLTFYLFRLVKRWMTRRRARARARSSSIYSLGAVEFRCSCSHEFPPRRGKVGPPASCSPA